MKGTVLATLSLSGSEICVVGQAVCHADAAHCCLRGHSPFVVILSHSRSFDAIAGLGIRLSVVVSMLAMGHPSAIPGLAQGVT